MESRHPRWLTRLGEWLEKKNSEVREVVFGTVVYALLMLICLGLSQAYPFLNWLAVPGVVFGIIVALGILYFTILVYQISVARLVYNVVNIGCLLADLLLTLLGKIARVTRCVFFRVGGARLLSRETVSRLFTPIALFVVLLAHELWRPVEMETSDLLYLLVGSGVAKEIIDALVRRVIRRTREGK